MRRKRASDFPQELLDLFEVMCMAGSAAVNSCHREAMGTAGRSGTVVVTRK